jgi:predicted RNase H-like HicB family nuclease
MRVTAVYRHEQQPDGSAAWIVELAEEPRCHTFGRTLRAARRNVREAAVAWYEVDPSEVEVADDVRLPAPASRAIGRCQALRAREREAHRDASVLLGISHQRVHQLAGELWEREAQRPRPAVP